MKRYPWKWIPIGGCKNKGWTGTWAITVFGDTRLLDWIVIPRISKHLAKRRLAVREQEHYDDLAEEFFANAKRGSRKLKRNKS